jgi:hypothetical protein
MPIIVGIEILDLELFSGLKKQQLIEFCELYLTSLEAKLDLGA